MTYNEKRTLGKIIQDVIQSIVFALFIAVILRVFFFEAFLVPSASMENTIKIGDQLLVWKFLYNHAIPVINKRLFLGWTIHRKDIIIFKLKEDENLVKRVIGIPGDKIVLRDKNIYVNGERIQEPYLNNADNILYLNTVYEVPKDKILVLGDNRMNSRDSRDFGLVSTKKIIGKVILIYFPFPRIRLLK